MEIVLSKEDGTEFARFADAEELARWAVRVCVVADNEIERLKDNAASLRTQRDYLMAAARHYTVADDGLALPWHGRVWCNPPFGREAVKWPRRMRDHGNGIALVAYGSDNLSALRHSGLGFVVVGHNAELTGATRR